jgi:protein SCO1/2
MKRYLAWGLLWTAVAAPAGAQFNAGAGPGDMVAREKPPPLLEGVRIDQRLNEQVPADAVFRDETGREVRLGDYFGRRPVVLALVYFRCPKLCTLVLNGLTEAMKPLTLELGRDFDVVTVSFDPLDTPETAAGKKKNYLALYGRPGGEAGWHFLTGTEPQIHRVTEAVGYRYRYDPQSQQYIHPAGITILTPDGRIARYLFGIQYLPRDLRLALVEASQRKIGTPADVVLLYCFHYDATTGKYSANVMRLVRLCGGLSIAVLAGFYVMVWWRSRRAPPSPSKSD